MSYIEKAKQEFILDGAEYFKDKPELYLSIKKRISEETYVDLSEVKICGSAYWGARFVDNTPFQPGISDLDVGLISARAFCNCMSEVRDKSKNFSDQTVFPRAGGKVSSFEVFRDYAFKKGIIRVDLLPGTPMKSLFNSASEIVSGEFIEHFEVISFSIYDSVTSFAVKQASAVRKFRTQA